MLPIIGVPETVRRGLAPYRPLFCRDEGFAHVSRYVTGLILRRFLKKNIPHHSAEAGRIRISHLGNSGWRSMRLSIAGMAFLLSAMPF
jgi:hypothetical protein